MEGVIPGLSVRVGAAVDPRVAVDVGSPSEAPKGLFQLLQARAPTAIAATRTSPPRTDKMVRVRLTWVLSPCLGLGPLDYTSPRSTTG
jgi:hypothetical protein